MDRAPNEYWVISPINACLAQRLEHRTCNAMVIGSIPIAGSFTFFFRWFPYNQQYLFRTKEYEENSLSFNRWSTK